MITTRRSGNVRIESYSAGNGNVAVLERPVSSYNDYVNPAPEVKDEDLAKAKERMQSNLAKLMNYDKASEEKATVAVETAPVVEERVVETVAQSVSTDEDIKPTSTTMQFGDGDLDQMYKEMNVKTEEKVNYRLNAKGKIAVVLFSLITAVILALIIVNTGLLANLKRTNTETQTKLDQLVETYSEISETLNNSDNVVSDWAIQNGMIK